MRTEYGWSVSLGTTRCQAEQNGLAPSPAVWPPVYQCAPQTLLGSIRTLRGRVSQASVAAMSHARHIRYHDIPSAFYCGHKRCYIFFFHTWLLYREGGGTPSAKRALAGLQGRLVPGFLLVAHGQDVNKCAFYPVQQNITRPAKGDKYFPVFWLQVLSRTPGLGEFFEQQRTAINGVKGFNCGLFILFRQEQIRPLKAYRSARRPDLDVTFGHGQLFALANLVNPSAHLIPGQMQSCALKLFPCSNAFLPQRFALFLSGYEGFQGLQHKCVGGALPHLRKVLYPLFQLSGYLDAGR